MTSNNSSTSKRKPGRKSRNIVIVDNGKRLLEQFNRVFAPKPFKLWLAPSLEHAFELFEEVSFDVLVLCSSVAKEEDSGFELLEIIAEKSSATQILFFAFPKEISLAFSALKSGTYQYGVLPISDTELNLLIESALEHQPDYPPNLLLREERQKTSFENMIGGSTPMKDVYRQIRQAAMSDIPVMISGETGTGKDLVARAIHQLSDRSEKRFVPIHLASLPQDIVASELFGHDRGAFTGAVKLYKGSFERAHGGTVFLDEVGTMDEKNQVSLLRLLETRQFNRIGSSKQIKANVRIISATNQILYDAVEQGNFREDLYYRLEVFHISLPSVRDRLGDVSLLVNHFLNRFNEDYNRDIKGISPECVSCLESYDWPGNVREVKNVIHRAVVICQGEILQPLHLPNRLVNKPLKKPVVEIPVGTPLDEAEHRIIQRTLKWTNNNKKRTAAVLGISRKALYNKLAKHQAKT